MEKISVIIPAYKVENYLQNCVNSVIRQTYSNLEILLVDDGSPDNCGRICDELGKQDKRIKVIHQENRGLSAARNAGLDNATGDFIAFIDGDDYIDKSMIETLYRRLKADNSDIAICNYSYSYDGEIHERIPGRVKDEVVDERRFWEMFYTGNLIFCVVSWNKLYPRKLFEKERFDIGKIHEDDYICHRIFSQCTRISCVNQALYFYVQRDDSIMKSSNGGNLLNLVEASEGRFNYLYKKKFYYEATLCLNGLMTNIESKGFDYIQDNEVMKKLKRLHRLTFLHTDFSQRVKILKFLMFRKWKL